jgi:hypothetical protein
VTAAEAKALRVGDAVLTDEDGGHRGEVEAVGAAGVRVVWDDRRITVHPWADCGWFRRAATLPGPAPTRREPDVVQLLIQQAEELRTRAFEALEHGGDPIILAQDLRAAGESYCEAADEIARRARAAAKAGGARG